MKSAWSVVKRLVSPVCILYPYCPSFPYRAVFEAVYLLIGLVANNTTDHLSTQLRYRKDHVSLEKKKKREKRRGSEVE